MSQSLRRLCRAIALAFLIAAWSVPSAEADSPLAFIPEDAPIVARVKSPDTVTKTIATWLPASFHDSILPLVGQLLMMCGQSNDPAAECWVVEFCEPANEKTWVYIVQANDVGKIKGSYEGAAMRATFGEWQIFAGSSANGKRFSECRGGKVKSLAAAMDPKARELFETATVSMFVNAKRLRVKSRAELDFFKAFVAAVVQQCKQPPDGAEALKVAPAAPMTVAVAAPAAPAAPNKPADPGPPAAPPEAVAAAPAGGQVVVDGFDFVKIRDQKTFEGLLALWHGIAQLIEDTDHVVVGLTVDKGIDLQAYAALATNSPSDRFLARHPPSEMKPLERLPPGAIAYFGLSGELTELARWLAHVRVAIYEAPAAVIQAIDEKLQPLAQAPVVGYFGSIDFGRESSGPATSTLVVESGSTPKLREFESQLIELASARIETAVKAPLNDLPSFTTAWPVSTIVKRNAETIAHREVDLATAKVPNGSATPMPDGTLVFFKAFYGTNDLETRTTSLPGLLLQTTGGGRLAMAQLLRNFESGTGPATDLDWKTARVHAGRKANAIVMLDVPRLVYAYFQVAMILGLRDAAKADPQVRAVVTKFDQDSLAVLRTFVPSYSVLTVAGEPHAARLRLSVPREQVNGVCRLIEFVTKLMENAAPPAAKPGEKAPVDEQ
jgi:hypothetical protein